MVIVKAPGVTLCYENLLFLSFVIISSFLSLLWDGEVPLVNFLLSFCLLLFSSFFSYFSPSSLYDLNYPPSLFLPFLIFPQMCMCVYISIKAPPSPLPSSPPATTHPPTDCYQALTHPHTQTPLPPSRHRHTTHAGKGRLSLEQGGK
jgi:hypothetical protein